MKSVVGTLILAGALLATIKAFGDDTKQPPTDSEMSKTDRTVRRLSKVAPTMILAKDPQTGQLRPATAEEIAAIRSLDTATDRAGKVTVVQTLSDGHIHARLGDEYFRYSLLRRNVDGSFSAQCVPASTIDDAMKSAAPTPTPSAVEK